MAPTQQPYIQPQTVPVAGAPPLSYVQSPQPPQPMMQAVQPQAIQQVYYTTPQGQVIVQQQSVIQEQQLIQVRIDTSYTVKDAQKCLFIIVDVELYIQAHILFSSLNLSQSIFSDHITLLNN